MKWVVLVAGAVSVAACSEAPRQPSIYDGERLVKICMDGSRIFKLQDGRFVASGWGNEVVDNPETVCSSR